MKHITNKLIVASAIFMLFLSSCSVLLGGNPAFEEGTLIVQIPSTAAWIESAAPSGSARALDASRAFAAADRATITVTNSERALVKTWSVDNLGLVNGNQTGIIPVPSGDNSLPVGMYQVRVDIYNTANTDTGPVVSGTASCQIAKGVATTVSIPCIPVAPNAVTENSTQAITQIGTTPWSQDFLSRGGETWFSILPSSSYTQVSASVPQGSTARPRIGIFNLNGEFIATAMDPGSGTGVGVATLGFNSSRELYYVAVIDFGTSSLDRSLLLEYGPASEPADHITSLKVTIGAKTYSGQIDNRANTVRVFGVQDDADLSKVAITELRADYGACVIDAATGDQMVTGMTVRDFSSTLPTVHLQVIPWGSNIPTRTYSVRVSRIASGLTNSALAQISLESGLAMFTSSSNGSINYDGALAQFKIAASLDPQNAEAVMWATILDTATIIVDPEMQKIAREYLGLESYPATLSEVLRFSSGSASVGGMSVASWMNWQPRTSTSNPPFYSRNSDGTYTLDPYGDYIQVINGTIGLPSIAIPEEIRKLEDGNPSTVTIGEWTCGLVNAIVQKNPSGFNGLVDALCDRLLSERLDRTVAQLKSIPDSTAIQLRFLPVPVSIGKAEIETVIAFLESFKATLYLGKAISLNLPLLDYWTALNPVDNRDLYTGENVSALINVLYSQDTPFSAPSNFLFARADASATLNVAKAAYLSGLGHLSGAIDSILARKDARFTLSPNSALISGSGAWPMFSNGMRVAKILADKMTASINGLEPFVMPVPSFTPEWFAMYADPAVWPTASDWGSGGTVPPSAIAYNLAGLFERPLFALDSLIEMDPLTGDPKFYKIVWIKDLSGKVIGIASRANSPTTAMTSSDVTELSVTYGVKLRDLSFNGALVIGQDEYQYVRSAFLNMLSGAGYSTANAETVVDSLLVYDPSSGSLSAWLPVVPPHIAANSFLPKDSSLILSMDYWKQFYPTASSGVTYQTKGSFWWAAPDMGDAVGMFALPSSPSL